MQNDDEALRVFLIVERRELRSTIKNALRSAPDVDIAGEAVSVDGASEALLAAAPDIVVLDLEDDASGPGRIQRLRSAYPNTHVVAISSITDPTYAERVLRAGALGYLGNSSGLHEIPEAVRSVARAKAYVNRRVARKLLAHLMKPGVDDPHDQLTPREREVFDLLGSRDADEIADGLGLSVRTVQGYFRSIRAKLDLTSTSDLVELARQWQSERA